VGAVVLGYGRNGHYVIVLKGTVGVCDSAVREEACIVATTAKRSGDGHNIRL
jgi:hypothetical protein